MPIWLHRLLGTVLQIAGFFGGAIVGMLLAWLLIMAMAAPFQPPEVRPPGLGGWGSALASCCGLSIGAPLFFGGAWLGRTVSYWLFARRVPARCPQCSGRSYLQSDNSSGVRYRCHSSRHVYVGAPWQE